MLGSRWVPRHVVAALSPLATAPGVGVWYSTRPKRPPGPAVEQPLTTHKDRYGMARSCDLCGKTSMGGFNPQSVGMNRVRAHRRYKVNLQPLKMANKAGVSVTAASAPAADAPCARPPDPPGALRVRVAESAEGRARDPLDHRLFLGRQVRAPATHRTGADGRPRVVAPIRSRCARVRLHQDRGSNASPRSISSPRSTASGSWTRSS